MNEDNPNTIKTKGVNMQHVSRVVFGQKEPHWKHTMWRREFIRKPAKP